MFCLVKMTGGSGASHGESENRVARDYAMTRIEYMTASSDLIGYTVSDVNQIAQQFHSAQIKVLAETPHDHRPAEAEHAMQFEGYVKELKCRFLQSETKPNIDNNNSSSCAKLPKIIIKPFDGSINNWISFIQMFDSLVHNRQDLNNIEKLHYLLSSVQGSAYNLIKNFPLCNDNYPIAYKTLHKHFNRKRHLANAFYEKLLTCEPVKLGRANEIERVQQTFIENLSILETFQLPDKNFMLFQLLWSKLDKNTKEQFELEHNSDEVPSFETILSFLEKRYRALEAANGVPLASNTNNLSKQRSSNPKPALVAATPSCVLCSGQSHKLSVCPEFLKLDVYSRFSFVKKKGLCILCLSQTHTVKKCNIKDKCKICQFSHNTLLHFGKPELAADADGQPSSPSVSALTSQNSNSSVLFSTVRVLVKNNFGKFVSARALLDSGSACNFMTEKCARRLGLKISQSSQPVNGIGQTVTEPSGRLTCTLKPTVTTEKHTFSITAYVLPDICPAMPSSFVDRSTWKHVHNLNLADPDLHIPGPIDLLLSADVFASSLCHGLVHGEAGQPTAINTVFGWVLMGNCHFNNSCPSKISRSRGYNNNEKCFFVTTNFSLDESIKRFWETENVVVSSKSLSLSREDQQCENYFVENHSRASDGRFIVPLPFVDPSNKPFFSHSRAIALKRLLSLEKKLNFNPSFRKAYMSFMEDYADCNHLVEVEPPNDDVGNFYYIPHHGILRPESVSTPLRVVFDASSKDAKGISLNDTLLPGPKLQTNIFDLLVRFRWHAIVFTGDVKQMYRQILVPPEDADYQRILWRPDPVGPVRDYRLVTVTYGVSCAPYQALRTISQLAQVSEPDFPRGSAVLSRDIYVDDIVSGTDSVESALSLRSELSAILSSGGFHLRKWTSNHKDFFVDLPLSDLYSADFRMFEDASDVSLKILGLLWSPHEDRFHFRVLVEDRRCSKRSILSDIARIYDPLGFLVPVTFYAKYFMQLLWACGVSWDDEVPEDLASEWLRFKQQLPLLESLSLPRRMLNEPVSLQLHGFCDASERGYCAVLYIRTGTNVVELCCAKSKVAPLRKLSIPRLELQAAVLLSDLLVSFVDALKPFYQFDDITAWSDSTVALAWIKSCPSKWKTFVANRVSHIQDRIPPDCWRHVGTAENPADCGSRGTLPRDFLNNSLWWHGPSWLSQSEKNWPLPPSVPLVTGEEQRVVTLVASTVDGPFIGKMVERFSSLSRLKRVLAYCRRFLHNSKQKNHVDRITGALQPSELDQALMFLVKHVQAHSFSSEIALLKKDSPNSMPKCFRKLSPFVDDSGFLRVGGRLAHAHVSFEIKHPLLLPRSHPFTTLIIEAFHKENMHPGAQTLLNLITQKFWILSGKRAVNSVVSKCLKCFRANPKSVPAPLMGNLPSYRVDQIKPFSKVAIDYGGPFSIALGRGRGTKTYKSYICVFVCTSTKAVHIELASELSTDAFLAVLRRFVARRGRCCEIISDQGRNFVGASNYLDKLVQGASEQLCIKFSFNPPGGPHFNGLAEAGIKSVKSHLNRVVGDQRLTFEEFSTVLTQIEAMLNSRPLTPMSADPNDLSALTPGHFLTLEPLVMLPEENFVESRLSPMQRWNLIQKMHQDFWSRWHQEYLHTLQQKAKWDKVGRKIEIGALVLIVNEQCSPLKWALGRIITLHPGSDGICRVATVKTASGSYRRPIVKLCPLPTQI